MFLNCGKFQLDLSRPLVMGIVNITPDSFSDGGSYFGRDVALAHARKLIEDGADILDIGGESTRPGALPVSLDEEIDRVIPVIEGLSGMQIPISLDSFKPEVIRMALAAGASMINDINSLQHPDALAAVVESNAAVCLMHKQGNPQTMQEQPTYQDVLAEVQRFLRSRIEAAESAGIARSRIVVDPGFGFGKTLDHNLVLLRHLASFNKLGVPLLAGLSRKSMLGAITGRNVEQRDYASVAAALMAVERGAKIVRVHNVGATVDALKVLQKINPEYSFDNL
jgi:dihydropteroate synthase